MKKSDTHAFVNQLLVCLLVTICFGGSVGLGTVWMRHQISLTANANRALATKIVEVERHITETTALIEAEQSPEVLRQRNENWRLGLVPPSDLKVQLMRVTEDPVRELASANAAESLNTDRAPVLNLRVALGQ